MGHLAVRRWYQKETDTTFHPGDSVDTSEWTIEEILSAINKDWITSQSVVNPDLLEPESLVINSPLDVADNTTWGTRIFKVNYQDQEYVGFRVAKSAGPTIDASLSFFTHPVVGQEEAQTVGIAAHNRHLYLDVAGQFSLVIGEDSEAYDTYGQLVFNPDTGLWINKWLRAEAASVWDADNYGAPTQFPLLVNDLATLQDDGSGYNYRQINPVMVQVEGDSRMWLEVFDDETGQFSQSLYLDAFDGASSHNKVALEVATIGGTKYARLYNGSAEWLEVYGWAGWRGVALSGNKVIKTGSGATGVRPSAATVGAGSSWYDTTLAKPIFSNGTVWKDAAGTNV